jgi:hypothetical protein
MSYDLYLRDPVTKEVLELDEKHHMRGGTYCMGGEIEARLNCTFNYAKHYYIVFPPANEKCRGGIFTIHGLTGAESIPVLLDAAGQLGDETDPDYWKPTEGNAKRALLQLVALARMRPEGVWDVTS